MGLTKAHAELPDDALRSTTDHRPGPSPEHRTDELIEALGRADPEVRRLAVLGLRHQRRAIPALLAAYPGEPDPATREALLTVLAEHDDLEVAKAFAADLGIEDAADRNAAATALGSMPNSVAQIIDELIYASSTRVRMMAVTVLSDLEHKDGPDWLVGVVERDTSENVVAAAVDAALQAGGDAKELLTIAVRRFPDNPYLSFLARTSASTP